MLVFWMNLHNHLQ